MTVLINNRFSRNNKVTLLVTSEALLGYGIFETLRTYENKKLFRANDHLNRLLRGTKKIRLKINYSKKQILLMLKKPLPKRPPPPSD